MRQFIVDAFTDRQFRGNPAAVCVADEWPDDKLMLRIAEENNLSETAFIVREKEGFHLRWFTPGGEIELCGHATLASAYVLMNFYGMDSDEIRFSTLSGELSVRKNGDLFEMNFPSCGMRPIPVTGDMEKAFGAKPAEAWLGFDLVCVFDSEEFIRNMNPDRNLLVKLPGRAQVATAKGVEFDCVSRCFAPKIAVPEDPVTGSAHCELVPYWAEILGRKEITACQASSRGGVLHCRLLEDSRVVIAGRAEFSGQITFPEGNDTRPKGC